MKKVIKGLTILSLSALILTGCGSEKTSKKGKVKAQTLRVAFNQSKDHPEYKALQNLSEKLEKETNGAYKLDISPNALLGDQRATTELVQNGVIQMSVVGNPVVENFNKDFAVIGLPYVYNSLDEQKEVFTTGILDDLFKSTETEGFQVVGAYTAGSRSIYTNKAITKPEDLKGYKIRVMQSDTMKKMLDAMGGVGTPMSQSEVYTAIQQGVLEGGENNEITYADLKHYEVAPVFSYTNHLMVPDLIIINNDILNGMSDKNKAIFNKLIKESVTEEFKLWKEQVSKSKKIAEDNGAKFVEIDTVPFKNNVEPLQQSVINSSDVTKNIFDAIRKLDK